MSVPLRLTVSLVFVAWTTLPAQVAPQTAPPPRPALRVVKLTGTPKERGLVHGRTLRDEIRALVGRFKADLQQTQRMSADEFITRFYTATEFEDAIARWTPELLEEVHGIAEGAGIDYETMLVFQLVDEIWAQGKTLAKADKCTVVGADRSADRPSLLAQNLDIPRWYHGYQTLLHITDPKTKLQTFVITVPGLIGANGMNSARLGVAVNTLLQLAPCPDGLPVAFVVRGLLARRDWSAARRFLFEVRHASGQAYTIGGADVVRGFECSADRVTPFQPVAGATFTFHTNHPIANHQWSQAHRERARQAGQEPLAALRPCPRFDWLQRNLRKDAPVGLPELLAALRSKASQVPICNPATFACTVMILGRPPELRVSAGGADRNPLQTFRFDGGGR